MGRIRLGDKEFEYEVKRGNSLRYVRLSFKTNLQLEVVLPRHFNLDVEALLRKKQEWIARKYDELSNTKRVFDGKRVLYKGDYRELSVVPLQNPGEERVQLLGDSILIHADGADDALAALRGWMKAQTMAYAAGKAREYAEKLGVSFRNLYVRDMNKWGQCTRRRVLVFNSQLISLPEALAEYVVLHELAHLSEFNHSRDFLTKLAHVCPDFKERQITLKRFVTSRIVTNGS